MLYDSLLSSPSEFLTLLSVYLVFSLLRSLGIPDTNPLFICTDGKDSCPSVGWKLSTF